MIVVCCKCKRIRYGRDWTEAKHVDGGPATYTYCPKCFKEEIAKMDRQDDDI